MLLSVSTAENGQMTAYTDHRRPDPQGMLFINQYVVGESRKLYRPDRRIVGSHVQKLIRYKKRLRSAYGLKSAIARDLPFQHRPIQPKWNGKPLDGDALKAVSCADLPAEFDHSRTKPDLALIFAPAWEDVAGFKDTNIILQHCKSAF
jgi:hypothetical protein